MLIDLLKYEVKMHWRRRALLVIALSNLVLLVVLALVANSEESRGWLDDIENDALATDALTMFIMIMTWTPLAVTMAVVLPIAIADTIPLERQKGTAELLNSLPLTSIQFLQTKLIGVWVAAFLMLPPLMIVSAVLWWIQFGPYDVLRYASMWLLALPLLIVLNSAWGVLLPAVLLRRRSAVGLVALVLFVVLIFLSPSYSLDGSLTLHDYLHPIRPALLLYYFTQSTARLDEVVLTALMGLLEVGLLLAGAWWLMRRRETVI